MTKFGLRWATTKGEFFFSSKDNRGNPIQMHKYAERDDIIKECEDSLCRIEDELVPFCIENRKATIAYSHLQLRLLTGKIKAGHKFSEGIAAQVFVFI